MTRELPVKDWPYTVTDSGEIRRVGSPRALRPYLQRHGYLALTLSSDGSSKRVYVHQVVAAAFLGPRPEGHEVNHKDFNKTNNADSNLEYVTSSDNRLHALRAGAKVASKFTPDQVRDIREQSAQGATRKALARLFNTTPTNIRFIVNRVTWKYLDREERNYVQHDQQRFR